MLRATLSVTTQGRSFSEKLSAELKSRKMGARTLAKQISRQHGGSIDDRRRTIIRWLRGATPVTRNREIVEDVLGVSRDSLKGDDEDEESDLVSPFTVSVAIDYERLAEALVQRTILDELKEARRRASQEHR